MRWAKGIKQIRKMRKMTQLQVADKTGYARPTICQFENDERTIDQDILAKLLQALNIEHDAFFKFCAEPYEIKPYIQIPEVDMAKVNFADFWDASDKMFKSSIISRFGAGGSVSDPYAFRIEANNENLIDCGIQEGDHLIVTPGIKYKDGDAVLVLMKPQEEIFVRRIFWKGNAQVRLASEITTREEIVIDPQKTEVQIYKIKSYERDLSVKPKRRRSR